MTTGSGARRRLVNQPPPPGRMGGIAELAAALPPTRPIALSADGRLALTVDHRAGTLHLTSPGRDIVVPSLHSNGRDGINHAAFSPDGGLLAINDYGTIRILDVTDPVARSSGPR